MNRKTVDSILKGVAGVSLAFGGVSVLSDANLVYASEVEQPEETTQEESSSEVTPSGEDATKDDSSVTDSSEDSGSAQTAESEFEAEREAYIANQPDDTCTMSTAADAMKKAAEEANKSNEEDAPANEEGSEGGSVSEGEDTTQTLEDDDTDQRQEEDNADQNRTEDNAENQATDAESREQKLAELKKAVDDAQAKVDAKVDAAKKGNGKIDASYYRAADELTKAMIEYYAAVEGFDGDIDFTNGYCNNKWVSNGIDHNNNFKQNYLETTYTSGDMQDIVYYDYVNADKAGKWLTDTPDQDNANLIDHIVVLEKTPIFAVDGENDLFTFERDEFRNITAYIVNDEKIAVIVNENGERVIAESVDEEGAVVTTTVTGNNASGYTVTKTTFVTNADGETEQTSKSEKLYKVLKGFSGDRGGKGEVYKKDLVKEPEKEPENEPVTEYTDPAYTPGPSEPSTPQPDTPEPSTPEAPQPDTPETEIADEDVPLSDGTDVFDEDIDLNDDDQDVDDQDEDLTDLEDEGVPLAVLDLDEPVDIPDEDVPLSENPETGDAMTATWLGTAAASVAGLFGASRKKRKG